MIFEETIGMRIARADKEGDLEFLRYIFSEGGEDILKVTPNDKWNYLHLCLCYGGKDYPPPEVVQFYIDHGVEVNAQDGYKATPLYYALRAGNAEAASVLLDAGADPNIPDQRNEVPMAMFHSILDRLDVIEKMLKAGGNLHYINWSNDIDIFQFIKKYYCEDPEYQDVIALFEKYY